MTSSDEARCSRCGLTVTPTAKGNAPRHNEMYMSMGWGQGGMQYRVCPGTGKPVK